MNTVKNCLRAFRNTKIKRQKMLTKLVILSLIVAGSVSWSLHKNGESQTAQTYCEKEEHEHDESCEERTLICEKTEDAEPVSEQTGHLHEESCYETQNVLTCTKEEHEHSQENGCYDEEGNLICEKEEHKHSIDDNCYTEDKVLICGQEESLPEQSVVHVHTDDCYEITYTCGKEEHKHTLSCYSNPDADVEKQEDWEKTISNIKLTGDFAKDLIAVAQSQLGYTESTANYEVEKDDEGNDTDVTHGYTRYGAWNETPYEEWETLFIWFCMNYAGITDEMVPFDADPVEWIKALSINDLYEKAGGKYMAEPGDIIFYDTDNDGKADHVGIIEEVESEEIEEADESISYLYTLHTIEKDGENKVAQKEYDLYDNSILGYGSLYSIYLAAVDKGLIQDGKIIRLTAETEDGARFSAIGELPDNAVLEAVPLTEEQMEHLTSTLGLTGQFYDIHILVNGEVYQPTKKVRISIIGLNLEAGEALKGYHLPDVSADTLMEMEAADVNVEQVDLDNTGNRIDFDASGFSVYGVSMTALEDEISTAAAEDGTYPIFRQLTNIDVTALGGKTFAITSYGGKRAMTATEASGGGLEGGAENSVSESDAIWTFVSIGGSNNQYRIRNTSGQYLGINNNNLILTNLNNAITFTVSNPSGDTSHILLNGNSTYINALNVAANGNETAFTKFSVWNTTNAGSQLRLYSLEDVQFVVVNDTVSPSSTVINLFDYWLDEKDTSDYQDGNTNINSGIDTNHALKFCLGNIGGINSWTGSAAPKSGMVEKLLANGYPVLKEGLSYNTNGNTSREESLNYLFDPTVEHNGKASYANVQNLLTVDKDGYYYYNSRERYAYYNQETNSFTEYSQPAVNGNSGYGQFFPFNTLDEAVGKNSTSTGINHYFGVSLTARFIQDHDGYTDNTHQRATTFEFSGDDDVWIFIDDVLVADLGGIHDAASVTINFASGDVSINGSSVGTLKSFYEAAGKTWTNGDSATFANNSTHTLKFFYLERGNVDSNMKLKYNLTEIPATSIFKVDQYGDYVSGATFAFYPASVAGNVDSGTWSYAASVDAETGVVTASTLNARDIAYDSSWNITHNGSTIPALYYGRTDSNGSMVFVDSDGMPMSLEEIQKLLGSKFIMREVVVPDGFRTVADEAFLYIANNKTLMCSDPYGTGVWVSPDVKVTATNTLYVAETSNALAGTLNSQYLSGNSTSGYSINYYTPDQGSHGTLFAVVLKRNGVASTATDWDHLNIPAWYPLYGTDEKGYIVSTQSDLAASIAAAKEQAKLSSNVFTEQASGMQLYYQNLPGDPTRYYSYRLANNMDVTGTEPQYLIAYYWTTADSLDGADETNTLRISSHDETTPGNVSGFDDLWGATIEVPNFINALYFQKADTDGDLVDDAVFALYEAETNGAGKGFYKGISGETTAYIRLDEENGTAKNGAATVYTSKDETSGTVGTYTVEPGTGKDSGYVTNAGAGTITVTADGSTYTITPAVNAAAGGGVSLVGYTHDACDYVNNEEGTGHFHYIKTGNYFLKEVVSPSGYSMNYANIPVAVTAEGVYANAGTADDNVRVGNGAGYLVKTLDVFASLNNIDETLSWVKSHLKVKNSSSEFDNNLDNIFLTNGYLTGTYGFDGYGVGNVDGTSYIPTGALTSGTGEGLTTGTNDTTNAMTQYLRYEGDLTNNTDKNKIFDYALYGRGDGYSTGVQSYRLWTESGWSDLAVFQDTAYGQAQITTGSTTNYTVLNDEISHLFSSSTFVQVTDEVDIDLTVTKVTNDFEDADNNMATVYLDGAEFYLKNTSNQYYRYDAATDTTTWVTSVDDATKLVTETYFKETGNDNIFYSKISVSVSVENGVYSKIYTIDETDYTLSEYNNGTAKFTPVSGTGSLTGTLRRSYFKIYNLKEGTYTLTEKNSPTYDYTVGGATTTEDFNSIDDIGIQIRSGNYYYYNSGTTGNRIIVSDSDITFETQTNGTQIPKFFTFRDADGNAYENIPLTPAADANSYTYSFYTGADETGDQISGTLYQNTGNGFTLEVTGEAATRVFRVDNSGSTTPYYDNTTEAYQAGFRVLNTTELSDQSITLVKLNSVANSGSPESAVGYNDSNTTFTVNDGENLSTHNILTDAKFYLYYKTYDEKGVETPYYYGYAENGTTVQWSTELTNAQKFSVDELGALTFKSLNAHNNYYLVECKAPDGFNLLTEEINISWDGTTGNLNVSGAGSVIQAVHEAEDEAVEPVHYIVVYNDPGYELPDAGGASMILIPLSGLALATGTLMYGYETRGKKGRRKK